MWNYYGQNLYVPRPEIRRADFLGDTKRRITWLVFRRRVAVVRQGTPKMALHT